MVFVVQSRKQSYGAVSMNIHVSNLPTSITQHQIEDLFAAYGRVKNIRLLEDKHTGLPIGSAYVLGLPGGSRSGD